MTQDTLDRFVQQCQPTPMISQARVHRLTDQVFRQLDARTAPSVTPPGWMHRLAGFSRYGMPVAFGAASGIGLSQWLTRWSSTDGMADLFQSLYSLPMGF